MKKIQLKIVTPDRTVVNAPVDMVGAMGTKGAFTALPGHTDFLTALKNDRVWYRQDGQMRELAVSDGFIEVLPYHISILADSADYLEEIDVERAQLDFKWAKEQMTKAKASGQSDSDTGKEEIVQIEATFNRAAARLKLAAKKTVR
jgi:F-type H+-transporting ATPase subunit epsilon